MTEAGSAVDEAVHGASVTVRRALEWIDTDGANIWHYSTAIRFVEHAELVLHDRLGITDRTFGVTPRVKVTFDFHAPVRFGDTVATTITVARVGRTSIAYDLEIEGPHRFVARGQVVTVLTDRDTGEPRPVPDDLRALLTDGT